MHARAYPTDSILNLLTDFCEFWCRYCTSRDHMNICPFLCHIVTAALQICKLVRENYTKTCFFICDHEVVCSNRGFKNVQILFLWWW